MKGWEMGIKKEMRDFVERKNDERFSQ